MKVLKLTLVLAGCSSLLTETGSSQVIQDSVAELQGIDVIEHAGDTIPLDLSFTDDKGRAVTLGDYFNNGKPVLLVLGYYRCPMLCNLVFNGVVGGIQGMELEPGKDYSVVAVSINPEETYDLAAAKKKNYLESLGKPGADTGWAFLVGEESQSKALADAVGFQYYYVEERQEYAHPAVIYLLTEDGRISQYMYGIQFKPRDLKFGLMEASEGSIGSAFERVILYCYHYDPDAGGYVVFARNVMALAGAVTVGFLAVFLGGLWMHDRRRKHRRTVYHPNQRVNR